MPYAYYNKLTRNQKRIYNQSDDIVAIPLRTSVNLKSSILSLDDALRQAAKDKVQDTCQKLIDLIIEDLNAPPVRVKILNRRPSNRYSELHGLYEPAQKSQCIAVMTLWMRTAKRKQIVAFKTFLRTLLHELCHHLDYQYFKLEDSFHTEGFFMRESSLYKKILNYCYSS